MPAPKYSRCIRYPALRYGIGSMIDRARITHLHATPPDNIRVHNGLAYLEIELLGFTGRH